ncbi:ACT domain-containing protein [Flagelloscypha sp. PMI_526]|nr:ACT domain-containing protein [Flagelloscypha sp. PMI_526]
MAPPSDHPCLHLSILPGQYFVVKLDSKTENLDQWVLDGLLQQIKSSDVFSVTKTDEELSVLGKLNNSLPAVCQEEATWGALKIKGPMDFGLTGVIASLTAPLKEAGVLVFVTSTWNTDYVLIPLKHFENGVKMLKEDGWTFDDE